MKFKSVYIYSHYIIFKKLNFFRYFSDFVKKIKILIIFIYGIFIVILYFEQLAKISKSINLPCSNIHCNVKNNDKLTQ